MESAPNKPTPGLEKPSGAAKQPPAEPVIHVIPDQFYGAALRKRVPIEAPKAPVAQAKKEAAPASMPPKKGGKAVFIVIGIVVALAAIGATAYFVLLAPKPSPKPKPIANTNTSATGPVCGNGTCETGETSDSCAADCKEATATTCGDGNCDEDESFDSCPADCQPPTPQPAVDSDSDGLTDVEESEIYGTDPHLADTSGRGYLDGNQVIYLYDPASKTQGALLRNNQGIELYTSSSESYEILRPAKWTVKESDQGKQVLFNAPKGEFIEVLVDDNSGNKMLMDWYLDKFPGKRSSEVTMFRTRGGYDEILSDDQLTAYVASGTRILVISYNLGTQTYIRYRTTFQMMVNSLIIK